MYKHILIPLDGSPVAEQVLPLAKMLVVRFSSSVDLFQAIHPVGGRASATGDALDATRQIEPLQRQSLAYLERIAEEFPQGISVQREIATGLPAASILEFAERTHADLIAMATHGRTGLQRWAYGSVADKVLGGARLPVLLVRAAQTPHSSASIRRILVPLDGSELAERALIPAQHLAQAFDADLLLLRVQEPSSYMEGSFNTGMTTAIFDDALHVMVEDYLNETTRAIHGQGVRASWESQFGMPAESILVAIEKRAINLVVMSTHGRSGLGRWIMGSVADRVLRVSRIPVLLIRSNAVLSEGSDL